MEDETEIIRILHVDEHTLLRDLFAAQVERTPGMEMAGSTGDTEQALTIVESQRPDVAIIEARLSSSALGAPHFAARVYEQFPCTKVIVLSGYLYPAYVHELNRSGVKGYLLKTESWTEVVRAITAISGGAFVASPDVAQTLLSGRGAGDGAGPMLNMDESHLMSLVAEGLSNNQIADRLHVSESTVRSRVGRTLGKLGATSRTQAVTESIRRGFVVVD